VAEAAGIADIRAKALRSNNPCNVVAATFAGLQALRTAEQVAAIRGKSVKEILG
jgi:small subunit ribosomal protein S5